MTSSFDWDTLYAQLSSTDPLAELGDDQRWSTWPETAHVTERGPQPFPDWVVQDHGAVDTELGVLKTGKEADAFLLERAVPGDRGVLLVAKRYRGSEHSTFHRSHAYTEGRRGRDSREGRAISKGTEFGKQVAADRWARAEFEVLCRLAQAGMPVPYPVQIQRAEVLMEFIGTDDGTAAPRMHETAPQPPAATSWAHDLRGFVIELAAMGLAHGDLSPYNILIDNRPGTDRPVVIDVPQAVDVVSNAAGRTFLQRDCENVCTWLRAHGADAVAVDPLEWAATAWSALDRSDHHRRISGSPD